MRRGRNTEKKHRDGEDNNMFEWNRKKQYEGLECLWKSGRVKEKRCGKKKIYKFENAGYQDRIKKREKKQRTKAGETGRANNNRQGLGKQEE